MAIWLAQDYQRISALAQSKIEIARRRVRGLAISDVTLLEIAQLARHRRINLIPNAETVLSEIERRFVVLPITANIALQAFQLPPSYPKDPVDRIIGATALIEDIPLLTSDREIRKSAPFPTIW